ncbi:hypothetical protein ACT3CD_15630 [Geofilum sp. OHC36d9]|uniref:hypothetical protein n=1 Tax=Geofilum sp. OHC36d9 TaxID=3458413 RepID=UPI0040335C3F
MVYAWCKMTNHMHIIFRSTQGLKPEVLLDDFKRFTSRVLIKAIHENSRESRKELLLERFKAAGEESASVKKYQFWRHDNKPVELWSSHVINEKINYINAFNYFL